MRTALFHPGITHDMEETQEFGRRNGQRMQHPFWDVDLVNALYRVPPDLLMRDGRSKWLLRRRLEARLPGLGLERRTKVSAGGVFTGMMAREARSAWDGLGGLQAVMPDQRWPGIVLVVLGLVLTAVGRTAGELGTFERFLDERVKAERLRAMHFRYLSRTGRYAGPDRAILLERAVLAVKDGEEPL